MRPPRKHGTRLRAGAFHAALGSSLCFAAVALGLPPFTTAPKTATGGGQAELYAAAAGCHATYDRFVVRGRLATPGYDVRYVSKIVADGSGKPISLLGTKRIRVVIRPARATRAAGPTCWRARSPRSARTCVRSRRPAISRASSPTASG